MDVLVYTVGSRDLRAASEQLQCRLQSGVMCERGRDEEGWGLVGVLKSDCGAIASVSVHLVHGSYPQQTSPSRSLQQLPALTQNLEATCTRVRSHDEGRVQYLGHWAYHECLVDTREC